MNPWLYVQLISIILFITLIDWKVFSSNIWGGIIASIFQLIQNIILINTEMFKYNNVNLNLPDHYIFSIGIAFFIGTLFFQYIPRNMFLQSINVIIWTLFFTVFRIITKNFDTLIAIHITNLIFGHGMFILALSLTWVKIEFFSEYFTGDNNARRNIN